MNEQVPSEEKYMVACNYGSTQEFARYVNELIAAGWKPIGGIAVRANESSDYDTLLQAMVRE